MKTLYVDIGELGWSLYLYGYLNWKLEEGHEEFAVMTSQDRKSIYEGIGIKTFDTPDLFRTMFGSNAQDGFGLYGVSSNQIHSFFNAQAPTGYQIDPGFYFGCRHTFKGRMRFKPLEPQVGTMSGRPYILIFPRYRKSDHHAKRNIKREFYARLAYEITRKFPTHGIAFVGKTPGSYEFPAVMTCQLPDGSRSPTFTNYGLIIENSTIQDLVNYCALADAAIGGTSAPPKISLLQRVPTFIIGHEKQRFTVDENWMNTKVGFYEIGADEYQSFDHDQAIEQAIKFVKEAIA